MAEQEPTPEQLAALAATEECDDSPTYKAPAQKSLQEIKELDKDDESLRKYKEALLGGVEHQAADPNAPNIQVTRMTLLCDAAPSCLVLDLQGDLDGLKNTPLLLKEGVEYKVKINFKVNSEIVSGLKYVQNSYRKGVKVDKSEYMVGSYGPRPNEYEYITTLEEAPKGILARGTYNIKSRFTDDDKNNHLSWDWCLVIKKDWSD